MSTPCPEFPLDARRLEQFFQYMREFMQETPTEDRSLVWQEWIARAYEVDSETLMPSVEDGVRKLALEFRNDQAT